MIASFRSRHAMAMMVSTMCLALVSLPSAAAPMPQRVCDVTHYGARPDGTTNNAHAIQTAIDDCATKGGGIVRLAGGTFLSGPIVLKSHITLDIETGATLLGSPDHSVYPLMTVFGAKGRQSLVSVTDAEDLTITGGGTIDGNGASWWEEARREKDHGVVEDVVFRPRLVVFDHCRHILIDHVTIDNSPSWQVVPYYSDDVTIRYSRIYAPAHSPNTDGIDPFSSSHVVIDHMKIDDGDDNVAIKSGLPGTTGNEPSTGITVTNCLFLHGHGLSIGSEVAGGVQNVHVSDIVFRGTDNGVRIKSARDRGADISNLWFSDIRMEDVKTPLLITEYYPHIPEHDSAQQVTQLTPHFHDIHITNLTATGARQTGIIAGLPESPIRDLDLDHVHLQGEYGLRISNATVTAHDLTVLPAAPPPVILLDNAKVIRK
jgi:polygalacturonase